MRRLNRKMVLLLIFIQIMACSREAVIGEYVLQVIDGNGSGKYRTGFEVTIAANIAPEGKEFLEWKGDIDGVAKVNDSITTLKMPARDVRVSATYKDRDLGTPVRLTIDRSTKYQTIDGFGFFGAQDVWWGNGANMWSDAWGEKVISDLGITIWRNEYYPPAIPGANQDADWNKQKATVEGLKAKADKYKVDLKFIFTVWSPPADMKWQATLVWAGDENATRGPGAVSTKNGGTLDPNKYLEFANWLKAGINLYKDAGINLYGLSLQNEPMFRQSFNSAIYTSAWYNDLLIRVVPEIRNTFPQVKIFGSENMLDMEGASNNWPHFYHSRIKANPTAANSLDILAVHGYTDGVAPSSGSGLAQRWTNHLEQFSKPMNKPTWMTETSGYMDGWLGNDDSPGALALAQDIHAGLHFGNISAWVWWQGSDLAGIGNFNLMNGITVGKKYYASKHFYRYIRPGAVRVKAISAEPENIFVTAYEHLGKKTFTMVIINSGDADKRITLAGTELPTSYSIYRTTAGGDNCTRVGEVELSGNFVLPAKSIVTLQAGGDAL